MYPNIFNIPYFQQLFGGLNPQGGKPTYTASGGIYSGPFKNDTATPFRTVDRIGQYGAGLNSSAAQMYDYFRRDGIAADRGLPFAGDVQTIDDFLNRRNPAPIETPAYGDDGVPPPSFPTSGAPNIFNLSQRSSGGFRR